LARTAIAELNLERVTFHVRRSNKRLVRHIRRAGGIHEATLWQFYGRERTSANAAMQFALFRPQILKLAGGPFARSMLH
jgi:hypothetical protein